MKFLPIAAAVQIALSSAAFPVKGTVRTEENVRRYSNIVLFAQFEDTETYSFMDESRSQKIEQLCNAKGTVHSLSGYIDAISYGQMSVTSYFPQMKDGTVIPYKLSGARSDYTTCDQYALEILRNVTVPEDIPLDSDFDGTVDNVTLIIDGKADSSGDPLWAKEFTAFGAKLNGLSVGTLNMQNSHQIFEDIVTGAEGVLCHEFLHSIGYPDLYRHERTGVPVGLWDIMASDSVFVQYPLAYQRAAVSGWLGSSDITKSGTYTLAPASSDSGNRLYLLKTPLSDTEFFAVEYRKQGAKYSADMDVKIYGTGLCVYRVNTEADGNFKGDRDEIYVFRPDETGLDTGEGDLSRSNFGGTNAPDHIGSLDWSDGITDGALVYSNGINSGIRLSDITITDSELTFTAEFAERSDVLLWESADVSEIKKGVPYDITESPDGEPWLIASDTFSAQLYRSEDGSFTPVGQPLNASVVYSPKLAFCGGIPYVMYRDRDYCLRLTRMDTATGKWTDVYSGTETAQYADMTSDGTNIYLAYTEGVFPCKLTAGIFFTETGKLVNVGSPNRENVCNLSIACCGNEMVIGYRSITNDDKPQISTFPKKDSGKWNTYSFSDEKCSGVSLTSDGEMVVVTPWGTGCGAYVYENEKVTSLALPREVTENAFTQVPLIYVGNICVAVNSQSPDELALYCLKGDKWEKTGGIITREIVNELSLAGGNGFVCCSYSTSNNTPAVKRLSLREKQRVRGDVNADGEFSAADLVMLGRYLHGCSALTSPEEGDMCEDGIINIFDLISMRKALVNQLRSL